jgi:hypothetical protein
MNRQKLFSFRDLVAAGGRLQMLPALLAIVAVKALVLVLDANPRFFLWDSVTYLQGAIGGPLPRDRSFLYSLLIEAIAVPTRSMLALVIAQTLAGAISALLIYLILRKFLNVRFGLALATALLFAAGPSQLFYERMVMAEAFGGMIWLGFVALALAYMRDGRTFWLPVVALVGILAVSFRLNGTAVIVIVSSLLPLLRVWFMRSGPPIDLRRFALQLGVAIACTLVAHVCYRHIVADVAHTKPGYIGTEGLFMLGFVAPAIEQKDFRDTGCDADVLTGLGRSLHDPRTREYQLWGDHGLWAAMQHRCPQPEAAAEIVAQRAWARIPAKVLPMAFATTAQYFDDSEATWRMNSDLGRKGMLPLELIDITSKYFGFDVSAIAFTDTLTSVWFEHSRWWLTGCFLLAPFLAVALLWRMRRDADAAAARLLALMLIGLFLSQFLLSPVIVFRYLHPFPPMMILCATTILARRFFVVREFDDRQPTTGSPVRIAQSPAVADPVPVSSQPI